MSFKKSLFGFENQLVTLIVVAIIIFVLTMIYYFLSKKKDILKNERNGYVAVCDNFIRSMDNLVVSVMGNKFNWFTPYAIYLILYISIGNILGIFGWESPITSYTVTFLLGLVTFIGIYLAGINNHKLKFFLKYIKNPTEIIGQFSPLISITFRIFGNLTAGSVILFLFYLLTNNLTHSIPVIGYINLLGGIIAPVFHMYFDLFDGLVQSYIFLLLTLSYIGIEATQSEKKQSLLRENNFAAENTNIKNNDVKQNNENEIIIPDFDIVRV